MIPPATRIFVAVEPADMRRSIDGLAKQVREGLGKNPATRGELFVFVNRRRDRAKVLWRDATGWCLLYKRLDVRRVVLPASDGSSSVVIDLRALAKLLDGVDGRRRTPRELVHDARARVMNQAPISP